MFQPRAPDRLNVSATWCGPGIVCAASPVFGPGGTVLAALPVTGWSSRLDLERVAPAVRTAALALSRQLGSAARQ
jgi:DNA-binding IclR family transcriptional regulator